MTTHWVAHLLYADHAWPQSRPVEWPVDIYALTTADQRGFRYEPTPLWAPHQKVMLVCIAVGVISWATWKAIR
jgi:hypothetical protein